MGPRRRQSAEEQNGERVEGDGGNGSLLLSGLCCCRDLAVGKEGFSSQRFSVGGF